MTPHLRTFIDAIESAAGKRDARELTPLEKISLCVGAGVQVRARTNSAFTGGEFMTMESVYTVKFQHDGGNWQVIELK